MPRSEINGISLKPAHVLSLVAAGRAFRIAFTFKRIGVMDVMNAVPTASGDFTMTTNIEEQAATPATATAREPKATKRANVAPRKPRVAPARGKSGKKATPAKKGASGPKGGTRLNSSHLVI